MVARRGGLDRVAPLALLALAAAAAAVGPAAAEIDDFPELGSDGQVALLGHTHVQADVDGRPSLLTFGGYRLTEGLVHLDLNNNPDRILLHRVRFIDEVFAFDLGNGSWSRLNVTGERPIGRIFHSMALAPDGTSFTVFGGTLCLRRNVPNPMVLFAETLRDVWRFDIPTRAWVPLLRADTFPDCDTTPQPSILAGAIPLAFMLVGLGAAFYHHSFMR